MRPACPCSTCSPNRTDSPLATEEGLTHGHPATWRVGAREALGAPAFVLGVGYVGYGSLAQSHGFSLFATGLSTIAIWALPGQLILVEMEAAGAPFLAILFAVAFSASRFLPMAVTLIPHLRVPGDPPWRYYFAGHVLAMTSWAVAMRRFPEQPVPARLPYFLGFAMTLWLVSLGCTLFGHSLAGTLPAPLRLAFIFANPLYFILILTANLRDRMGAIALLCGAVAGPALHLVVPAWSVVGGGVLGGSLAYLIARRL
jgi:predicted branched-subunit amino acid permease